MQFTRHSSACQQIYMYSCGFPSRKRHLSMLTNTKDPSLSTGAKRPDATAQSEIELHLGEGIVVTINGMQVLARRASIDNRRCRKFDISKRIGNRVLAWLCLAGLLIANTPVLAKNSQLKDQEIVLRAGETLDAVVNDQVVRIRIDPDAVSIPTMNSASAERIGLKRSLRDFGYIIGPVTLMFNTDNVRYVVDDGDVRIRTAFGERQVVEGADAIAGPQAFPYRRVTLILREAKEGDRPLAFPLEKDTGLSQTGVKMDVAGQPIYAAFSFARAQSLVTATGARWIADEHHGRFTDETSQIPVLYGVSRPVRSLALGQPLMLGELEIRNLAARVSDAGNADGIPEEGAGEVDLNEIVVTAQSGRKLPTQRLYIGMDTIGHCASITYDFDAQTVTLSCPDQPGVPQSEGAN